MCVLDRHTDVVTSGTAIAWTSGSSRLTTLTLTGVSRPVGMFSAVDARLDDAGVVEEVRAGVGAVAGDVGVGG